MAAKTEKKYYDIRQFVNDAAALHGMIGIKKYSFIHGVPQGGVPLALALSARTLIPLVDEEELKNHPPRMTLVVDDLIDSGTTRERYAQHDFACLHVKRKISDVDDCRTMCVHNELSSWANAWIVYWWEGTQEKSIKDSVLRQLQFLGEDASREGLVETPARVIKSWDKLYGGYKQEPMEVLKLFQDNKAVDMVLLKDIEFYSTCEHHMLPFFGKAHVAYVPDGGRVVGISKLARLVEVFARRLQIQERIGWQVTNTLVEGIRPLGAACVLEAQHFCMTSRGVEKQNSIMVTSSLQGVFLNKADTRAELMRLIK